MAIAEKEIVLRLPTRPYRRLQERARQAGKTPELLTREIVEQALQEEPSPSITPSPRTARQILQATGRARALSPALQRKIIPGVTLEEVRTALGRVGGQSLSEIVLAQRGSRS